MTEDQPLEQFQTYYGSPAQTALADESTYVQLREAFYAGFRARPAEPIEPSPNALEFTERPLARYASRFPRKPQPSFEKIAGDDGVRFLPAEPMPDYYQHGTVTGRFPSYPVVDAPYSEPEVRLATSGILQQPITDMPRRDPDKAARMREAYGIQTVAGPSPATLERIHDQLKRDGVVNYPSDDTRDFPVVGLEHTETVFDGNYGAPGPVQSIPELMEDPDAAS